MWFLKPARKTPGFGGFCWFCAQKIGTEVRLFLNELKISIIQ